MEYIRQELEELQEKEVSGFRERKKLLYIAATGRIGDLETGSRAFWEARKILEVMITAALIRNQRSSGSSRNHTKALITAMSHWCQ